MDTGAGPNASQTDERRAQLRAEALRQLRWQKHRWEQVIAQAPPGAPVLTSPQDRVWLHGCLDLLCDAGEVMPQAFYRRGSVVPASREEGRPAASISLTALVADITRVLAVCTEEANEEPDAAALTD